jgi:mono/diheme cytochrome c family protein
MNRFKVKPLYGFFVAGIIFMISCKHDFSDANVDTSGNGTGTPPSQTSNCSADSVYFANEIQPLINSSCATSGCHDAATRAEGVELTTYNKIRNYAVPFNAAGSKLYKSMIKSGGDRMPPPPKPAMTAAQLAKVVKWINQGAQNNQCTGGCDTTVFTYAAAIAPMMSTFCNGCHNPSSLGGGIDVSTYTALKVQVLNGKLMGSIAHTSGFSAMPKSSNKLLDCQIRQVEKWIQAGSLNN